MISIIFSVFYFKNNLKQNVHYCTKKNFGIRNHYKLIIVIYVLTDFFLLDSLIILWYKKLTS